MAKMLDGLTAQERARARTVGLGAVQCGWAARRVATASRFIHERRAGASGSGDDMVDPVKVRENRRLAQEPAQQNVRTCMCSLWLGAWCTTAVWVHMRV